MINNICVNCIHAEVCRWCDSATQDVCDFYECDGDWIKADVLQEIRQEIVGFRDDAEIRYGHQLGFDKIYAYERCIDLIDGKIKELSE